MKTRPTRRRQETSRRKRQLFPEVGPPVSTPLDETEGMKSELGFVIPTAPAARRALRPRRPAQLNFALPASPAPVRRPQPVVSRRPCPRKQADWWFNQMRQLVAEGRELDAPGVF
jgi:hypothetical protein